MCSVHAHERVGARASMLIHTHNGQTHKIEGYVFSLVYRERESSQFASLLPVCTFHMFPCVYVYPHTVIYVIYMCIIITELIYIYIYLLRI